MWTLLKLSLLVLASPVARAAPVVADRDPDVVAAQVAPISAEALYPKLLDLRTYEAAMDCTRKWERGDRSKGIGASARTTYKVGLMHRRLVMVIAKAEENDHVDLEHAGKKGFVTRWKLEPQGDSTRIEVHTYIQAPPRPFQSYYFNKVQPAWAACQDRAITSVIQAANGS